MQFLCSFKRTDIAVEDAAAASDGINFQNQHSGTFVLVSGTASEVTWYVRLEPGGTPYPAFTESVDSPVAVHQDALSNNQAYPVPVALAGAFEIIPVCANDEAGVMAIFTKE